MHVKSPSLVFRTLQCSRNRQARLTISFLSHSCRGSPGDAQSRRRYQRVDDDDADVGLSDYQRMGKTGIVRTAKTRASCNAGRREEIDSTINSAMSKGGRWDILDDNSPAPKPLVRSESAASCDDFERLHLMRSCDLSQQGLGGESPLTRGCKTAMVVSRVLAAE